MQAEAPFVFGREDLRVLRPSQVMRLVKAGKIREHYPNSVILCQKCGRRMGEGYTNRPTFWENGMYSWCTHCNERTLCRPRFEAGGFDIYLGGERKVYPLTLPLSKRELEASARIRAREEGAA